jgi:hypothetical protein
LAARRPAWLDARATLSRAMVELVEWLDMHEGSALVLATLVLAAITAYYAWTTRALVRESHATLQATARATLQERLDRISEILMRDPRLFQSLDEPLTTGQEYDARFHLANMFVAVLEEAHTQYAIDRSMGEEDWRAWVATAELLMRRKYMLGYWEQVRTTFNASFRRFVEEQIQGSR